MSNYQYEGYPSPEGVRNLPFQNPVKEKLIKEINKRCEEKMRIKGCTKNKLAKISRNLIKHTSHKEV